MHIQDVLVVYMQPQSAAGRRTLELVKSTLLREGVSALVVERNRVDKRCCWQKDLIITVGGDGTFLRASHFVGDTPMLGVNIDPASKLGFYTSATAADFAQKFRKLRVGKFKIIALPRLQIEISRKALPDLALNEVFFGDRLPYKMCRYKLTINGRSEEQRSSGVLVSTGAGSHAWMQSAGGKRFPITAEKMEYLVREPYHLLNRKGRLRQGFVGPKGKIQITSRDKNNFIIIDALTKLYPLPAGKTATIRMAKERVRLVTY